MYIPDLYKNEDQEDIRDFLKSNAFGILVTHHNETFCATHIPLELATRNDGTDVLQGHISKANEQVAHLLDGSEALCIFNGPHSYISASWYDFEEVSTWNYVAVHVRGNFKILDAEGVYKSIKALMDKYEAPQKEPINMDKLSDKTIRQINGVVGFEIEISKIEAVNKMSQNRDDKNHAAILSNLQENGTPREIAVAEEMKRLKNK